MNYYILDDDFNPVLEPNREKFYAWFEKNQDTKILRKTFIGGIELSTVFLGIDHSFNSENPILYESLWFGGNFDGVMRRYRTREEAYIGHDEMLQEMRQFLDKKKKYRCIYDLWSPSKLEF